MDGSMMSEQAINTQSMEYSEQDGEIEITGISDFDLTKVFECGQCFRWGADENGAYTGVAHGRAVRLRSVGGSVFISGTLTDFKDIWCDYFDLNRDYSEIRRRLCIDDFMKTATTFSTGIRILQQDRWEALCSFIISQCNNIPRIKKIIAGLCRLFGEPIEFEGNSGNVKVFYSFPSAEKIATLNDTDLAPIRCGYRAEYIIGAARAVSAGRLDLTTLSHVSPGDARAALKRLRGVGDKVADCVMLFGLGMLDAFPQDVWMKRAVAEHYGPEFDPGIFSPYAGIAQQYIFHYMRVKTAPRDEKSHKIL